jgi:hypothetical protein
MEPQPSKLPIVDVNLQSVDKRDQTWFFNFTDNVSVLTEQFWRLRQHGRIKVTSQDHGHQFGLTQPVDARELVGLAVGTLPVVEARIDGNTGDLFIAFSEDVQLEFLQTSSGYESWRANVGGDEFTCGGGGEILGLEPLTPEQVDQAKDRRLHWAFSARCSSGFQEGHPGHWQFTSACAV